MFTGIVEEIGLVRFVTPGEKSARLTFAARTVLEDMHPGDSISVSGVCLTVVSFDSGSFTVDVSPETLSTTILGDLKPGDSVNLERAIQAQGRLGGHLVSGHVDGVGVLMDRKPEGNAIVMTVSAPKEILDLSVPKGSIAVDGISLTINEINPTSFSVSVIPHTAKRTTLADKKIGSRVNLESDLIGRYVRKFLAERGEVEKQTGNIDIRFLSEHGFT